MNKDKYILMSDLLRRCVERISHIDVPEKEVSLSKHVSYRRKYLQVMQIEVVDLA